MITFHNESLAPPEICRLLTASVPEDLHVPVVFHNGRIPGAGRGVMGQAHGCRLGGWIDISLSMLWADHWETAPELWRKLLHLVYHEFGHIATDWCWEYVSWAEYKARGAGHYWTERLAARWADQRIAAVCDYDGRLGQPRRIGGYLGARLARQMKHLARAEGGGGKAAYIREWRFLKTGGQLTAGEMLGELRCHPWQYSNAYQLLRQSSTDIGIDYTDAAGRHHRLYTWGDVPLLQRRLDRSRLRTAKLPEMDAAAWG